MYGTLRGALEARQVEFDPKRFTARVEGLIEGTDRAIRITHINVHYFLLVAASDEEKARRALKVHPQGCPAHESVKDAIAIAWDADLETY